LTEFAVTVRTPTGAPRAFTRTAASAAELAAALRAEGFLVLSLEPRRAATEALPPLWHPAWWRPLRAFDVEMGFRQLASLLRGGVALLAGLKSVEEQAPCARARRAWREVREAVYAGRGFASALGARPRVFDELAQRLTEVGERTGELERAVTRAADQMEGRRELRATVVNALIYPVLAVMLAVAVSAYLVVAVIPKVAEFLEAGGAELPHLTQLLVDVSLWLRVNGLAVLAVLAGSVAAWCVVRCTGAGREGQDVFLLHLPVVGRVLRLAGTALFARAMQTMTEAGVTLVEALAVGARLLPNRRLRRRVAAAQAAVVRGSSLADALLPAREFMPMLRQMAAIGEVSGTLPETFGETARFHEMLLARTIKRFGMLIEPVMIVITGTIVGFVYIAFFMAIFALAGVS